jgi:hypothetical protein
MFHKEWVIFDWERLFSVTLFLVLTQFFSTTAGFLINFDMWYESFKKLSACSKAPTYAGQHNVERSRTNIHALS